MIIGFAGRARHGKDYSAAHAAQLLRHKGHNVVVNGFANELKDRVGRLYNDIPDYDVLREQKPAWLRRVYQAVGENTRQYDPNFWVDRLLDRYRAGLSVADFIWLVPDVRFANEVEAIKYEGGVVLKVVRENMDGSPYHCPATDSNHPSEAEIDAISDRKFDAIIYAKTGMTGWIETAVKLNLERWGLL